MLSKEEMAPVCTGAVKCTGQCSSLYTTPGVVYPGVVYMAAKSIMNSTSLSGIEQCSEHCNVQCDVHYGVQCSVQCAVQFTVECSIQCKAQ